MNLEYIKQLEDLKQQRNQLSQEKSKLVSEKINCLKNIGFDEFKNFFSKSGFVIDELSEPSITKIVASYFSSKVELLCENKDFLGAYAKFELTCNMDTKEQFIILLNSGRPRITIQCGKSYSKNDPNGKILSEIHSLKEDIFELEKTISNIENLKLFFFIKGINNKKFNSMAEVLQYLFK